MLEWQWCKCGFLSAFVALVFYMFSSLNFITVPIVVSGITVVCTVNRTVPEFFVG